MFPPDENTTHEQEVPEAQDEMQTLREGIDSVDEEIVRLLDRRAWLARRIGEIKHKNGLAAYAPARERAVLDRVSTLGDGEFPRRGLQAVFREIISSSISLEGRLKVAYLGPEATFTHEAALRSFGSSIQLEPQRTVAEVFARVERGEVEHGVVPVENSMEGAVTHTLDELMNSPLKICGEVYLPVSQNLISVEQSMERVSLVCSHPMALAQAASWLRRELPGARLDEVDSTAEAARRAAVEPGVAAIGSVLAAGAHGLTVLARNIRTPARTPRALSCSGARGPRVRARTRPASYSPSRIAQAFSGTRSRLSRRRGSTLPVSRDAPAASVPGPTCSSRISLVIPRRTG